MLPHMLMMPHKKLCTEKKIMNNELQVERIMPKTKSTFEKMMEDPKQKEAFDKEYANFLLSELLLDAMAQEKISVRKLSSLSGISTSVIQNLRAMQPVNITLKTLTALLAPLGYELAACKGKKVVKLSV